MTEITFSPFTLAVSDDVLADLRARLGETRFVDTPRGAGWSMGMEADAHRALLAHWRAFDWRRAEAEINRVPAFRTEIDGQGLHFVHVRGEGSRRLPLVLTNGWPSCFTELLPLVPLLTREIDGLAFDVVIPSLPGYGFSDRPRGPGMNITAIAALTAKLMRALGYERFLAHGSDMGAGVVERLRANHGEMVLGVHMVNVFRGYPPPDDLSAEERAFLDRGAAWQMQEGAYAMLQATKPQTIAAALNDSPAGLAAWIGEKVRGWSDGDAISLDTLATLLTIYWVTETIGSSQRLYREAFADVGAMSPPPRAGAPVGVAIFPKDIVPAPRAWAERWFDLAYFSELPKGGHFPGFEVPELLAQDLRAFVAAIGARPSPAAERVGAVVGDPRREA